MLLIKTLPTLWKIKVGKLIVGLIRKDKDLFTLALDGQEETKGFASFEAAKAEAMKRLSGQGEAPPAKGQKFHYLQVMDLGTGRILEFRNVTPKEAVLSAYAQSVGDRCFPEKYIGLLKEGPRTISCGVYKARLDGGIIDPNP